jgi:hypothetical protein
MPFSSQVSSWRRTICLSSSSSRRAWFGAAAATSLLLSLEAEDMLEIERFALNFLTLDIPRCRLSAACPAFDVDTVSVSMDPRSKSTEACGEDTRTECSHSMRGESSCGFV